MRILPGNIGYIEVNLLPRLARSQDLIAGAFALVHDTVALIIDARGNSGGDPQTEALYLSYLSEGPPHPILVQDRQHGGGVVTTTTDLGGLSYGVAKPVYYLTSRHTFSGGEGLAYDIEVFKRGTVVGEATGGGGHMVSGAELGNGFVAMMPVAAPVSVVTGTNWDGTGVKPGAVVPAAEALIEAQRLAIARLRAAETDPVWVAAYAARLGTLQVELAALRGVGALPNLLNPALLPGLYPAADGRAAVVKDCEGLLCLEAPPGSPPARLISLGGDRYRCEGQPDDFIVSFDRDGTAVRLVTQFGDWPPLVGIKQLKPSH